MPAQAGGVKAPRGFLLVRLGGAALHQVNLDQLVDGDGAAALLLDALWIDAVFGAADRLGRDLSGRYGSEAYAMEECVADLAASFVLADLGIAHRPRPDHAAYLASWVRVLKHDPRAIFTAASKAQAVADWMTERQGEPPP
jgi:antirestriction protein ArdC